MSKFSKRAVLTMLAQTALAGGAQAQPSADAAGSEQLETVVVTAERRSEDVQKTAVSVNVQSGEELLREGRYSLQSILEDIPGVSGGAFVGLNNSGTDAMAQGVTIRGVQSNTSTPTISNVPSTAIYVDGVYEGVGGGYDIERVEVLRGPQGTLYGRSATAGVIAYHTRNPQLDAFGAQAVAEVGNYALQHYTGVLNVPLVNDVLALRVASNKYSREGYDSRRGGKLDNTDAKAKLLYRPSDTLAVLLGFAYQKNRTNSGGGQYLQTTPDSFDWIPSDDYRSGVNFYRQYWAEVNWDLGAVTLTYLPALRSWHQDAESLMAGTSLGRESVSNPYTPLDDFNTHELRLASQPGSKLAWQAGAFYYDNKLHYIDETRYLSSNALQVSNDTQRKTLDVGVFAEATYSLTQAWRVTAGLRYDDTEVKTVQDLAVNLNGSGDPGSPNLALPEIIAAQSLNGDDGIKRWHTTTYKLRLEHDLTPQNLLYAMVATGFLPGDVRVITGVGGAPQASVLDSEILKAYEIGSKNRFLSDTLQINGSLFYYDYGAYQNNAINLNEGTPFFPSVATIAAPVEVKGGELEVVYQISQRDRAGLSVGYTDAQFVDKSALFATHAAREHVPGSPPWTANLSYSRLFNFAGGASLTLRGDVNYRSSFISELASQRKIDAGGLPYLNVESATVGNLGATWVSSAGKWSLTGYVRNVADDRNQTRGTADLAADGSVSASGSLADPRTFGLIVNFNL